MDERTCRICLKERNKLISVFMKQEDTKTPYQLLLQLKLIQTPFNGPAFICTECSLDLNNCVKFFDKCEKASKVISSKYAQRKNLDQHGLYLDQQFPDPNNIVENVTENGECAEAEPGEEIIQNQCTKCDSNRSCVHKPSTVYTCDICQKVFTKKFNLTIHVKRHLGLRDCPCPTCGAPQLSSWHAKHHCARESLYQCTASGCMKSYTAAHNLRVHIRSKHTGERPHKCTYCAKRFASPTVLKCHTRIHTGDRPYMCPICGAQFTTNKLIAHIKTHERVKKPREEKRIKVGYTGWSSLAGSHPCPHCSLRYSHKQSLNRHIRKQHQHFESGLS